MFSEMQSNLASLCMRFPKTVKILNLQYTQAYIYIASDGLFAMNAYETVNDSPQVGYSYRADPDILLVLAVSHQKLTAYFHRGRIRKAVVLILAWHCCVASIGANNSNPSI